MIDAEVDLHEDEKIHRLELGYFLLSLLSRLRRQQLVLA